MKFLVDANVLSELVRPVPDLNVVAWMNENEPDLVVSPIILGEVEFGILRLAHGRQRRHLEQWFSERIRNLVTVDFTAASARVWAQLLVQLKQAATPMPINDSLIAASALEHNLTVATRNVFDFKKAGVPLINPFEARE